MPLFEYECLECGCRMEIIQRLKERPLKKVECDDCGVVRPVKKLLSAPAFQFKGEGWYVTDYANKKGDRGKDGKEEGADSSSSKDSESSKDKKTDGKSKSDNSKSGASEGSSKSPKSSKSKGSSTKTSKSK